MTPATIGIVVNANRATLAAVSDGELLDRRTVLLTNPGLPSHPHHGEGSWAVGRYLDSPGARPVSMAEALDLVERVRRSARSNADLLFAEMAFELPVIVGAVALAAFPAIPDGAEARIRDHRAQTMADTVMYREELAAAATDRGWNVVWYDPATIREQAARASGVDSVDSLLAAMGRSVGAPWRAEHKLAAVEAMAAPVGSLEGRT